MLQTFFYPRGVALVGSTSPGKIGYELLRQMLAGGYEHISAVNPRAQGMGPVPGYRSLAEVPPPVDLAVIVSPPPTVASVLADCGQAGVPSAIIITAGFSEAGNQAGEEELKRVAAQYGVRFAGPNCAGMVNTAHRLFPTLETRPPAGNVAIVAQSGAVGGVLLAWAKQYGLGISKFISYGNGADLNEIDFLDYLADDPETAVIGLYIEAASGGREFMAAVRRCTARKPVVVIKAGRTRSGQRATLSHTGSLAGADAVYDAALRQCGALRVHTIEEMFDLCKGFAHLGRLAGRKIAIVTNSGGPGVLAADRAEEVGLDVAEPSAPLKEQLAAFLPPYCGLKNPVDLTVEGTEEGYRRTLLAVLEEYDAALALNVATPYLDSVALARGVCDAAEQSGRPLVAAFLPEKIVAAAVDYLQERGVPNFATGERAVTALARMAGWRPAEEPTPPVPADSPRPPLPPAPILEPAAMEWLAANGLPTPALRFAATEEEAVRGAREIGYPVVMKIVSPRVLHKSDVGGVVVGVAGDEEARRAFARLSAIVEREEFAGVVIYPLVRDGLEVLLGLSRDPQFGPVVAFGLGGIYTEVWRDVSLRVAPLTVAEAERMIREIRAFPLLRGVRGRPPRDLAALAETLAAFSHIPFRYPQIQEVDLNPVFLLEKGLLVGDVRVIVDD